MVPGADENGPAQGTRIGGNDPYLRWPETQGVDPISIVRSTTPMTAWSMFLPAGSGIAVAEVRTRSG